MKQNNGKHDQKNGNKSGSLANGYIPTVSQTVHDKSRKKSERNNNTCQLELNGRSQSFDLSNQHRPLAVSTSADDLESSGGPVTPMTPITPKSPKQFTLIRSKTQPHVLPSIQINSRVTTGSPVPVVVNSIQDPTEQIPSIDEQPQATSPSRSEDQRIEEKRRSDKRKKKSKKSLFSRLAYRLKINWRCLPEALTTGGQDYRNVDTLLLAGACLGLLGCGVLFMGCLYLIHPSDDLFIAIYLGPPMIATGAFMVLLRFLVATPYLFPNLLTKKKRKHRRANSAVFMMANAAMSWGTHIGIRYSTSRRTSTAPSADISLTSQDSPISTRLNTARTLATGSDKILAVEASGNILTYRTSNNLTHVTRVNRKQHRGLYRDQSVTDSEDMYADMSGRLRPPDIEEDPESSNWADGDLQSIRTEDLLDSDSYTAHVQDQTSRRASRDTEKSDSSSVKDKDNDQFNGEKTWTWTSEGLEFTERKPKPVVRIRPRPKSLFATQSLHTIQQLPESGIITNTSRECSDSSEHESRESSRPPGRSRNRRVSFSMDCPEDGAGQREPKRHRSPSAKSKSQGESSSSSSGRERQRSTTGGSDLDSDLSRRNSQVICSKLPSTLSWIQSQSKQPK